MSDWADRKKQRLISRANDEAHERQLQAQVLASARPFWEDMIESMEKSKDAWNADASTKQIFIHKAGSPADSLGLIVRGPDGEITLELHYNIPQIRYVVGSIKQTHTLRFALDHEELRIFNKAEPTKRYSATQAADFFLDQVVHG